MKNKKIIYIILLITLIVILIFIILLKSGKEKKSSEITREIKPVYGDIQIYISTTGDVQPQNRLEIKPQISGRIEKVLVNEGDKVRTGQVLAWMSSTERAALLDSARAQGKDVLKYWEEAYKPMPLVAPIYGEVIVRNIEPGQTVSVADSVIVLSDRLIVEAQVDETDIGKIKLKQRANITLDAYPDIKVGGRVDKISYESTIVNNVTIYKVDIVPDKVPSVFRSGMSANVDILTLDREHVITIPSEAVIQNHKGNFVLLEKNGEKELTPVNLGATDEKIIEIISGVSTNDKVLITTQKFIPPQNAAKQATSPFLPQRRRQR